MNEDEAQRIRDLYIEKKLFSKFPKWISYGQGLSALSGSEIKILVCLFHAMNIHTGIGSITRKQIHESTGVAVGAISGIIHGFVVLGFIRVEKDGRNNIYHVQFDPLESWPLSQGVNYKRVQAASRRREIFRINLAKTEEPSI